MTTPNFFQIANSELTQDGFIQWLLEWANPKYKEFDSELHKAALAFVRLLLLPDDSTEKIHVSSVECEAQKNNIDVFALITDDVNNKKYAVIIEDKTETTVHDNQLVRYSMDVKERYSKWELHCVYLKTGNESKHSLCKIERDYKKKDWVIANKPIFKMVLRENILKILDSFAPQNVIYSDFVDNQKRIQQLTDTYLRQDKPVIVGMWGNTAWQGFLMGLENKMNHGLEEGKNMGWWDNTHRTVKENNKGRKLSGWNYQMPKVLITEDKSICIYLYLCLSNLSIKACCDSPNHTLRFRNVEYINSMLENYNLKLVPQKVSHKSEITLASIVRSNGESFIDETQTVNIDVIIERLLYLHQLLPELARYITIK